MEQKIAIYMRSSLEQDEKKRNINNPDESDTIANQRKYLYENALQKGFLKDQIVEYVDDGHTGTNFNRPGFEQLIKDIEAGKIQAVMVKDFSRMGRDYIGVGEYVEQFFPLYNVRVISVNDNWDSAEHVGETLELDVSFRTIIYEMYSRDLSVKRKSANKARNKNGTFIGAYVPYGYKKIPGDTHSIVVDEECAPVVKRIFSLFNSGEKIGNIAKILTDEGVPTPAMAKGDSHCYDNVVVDRGNWSNTTVGRILKNEMYTGTLILNRWKIKEFKAGTCSENDPSKWLKFPGNHEAIISREDFEKAGKRLQKRPRGGRASVKKKLYPLYCGHCGGKLSITTRNEDTLICKHGSRLPADPCGQIEIRREVLEKTLLKAIRVQAKVLLQQTGKIKRMSPELRSLEARIKELGDERQTYHDKRMSLYQSYRVGELDKESFLRQKGEVLNQENECTTELEDAERRLKQINEDSDYYRENEKSFREYALLDAYEPAVVNKLISRAEVFNDGHMKIKWAFDSEFGSVPEAEAPFEEDTCDDKRNGSAVAIYTSDMFLMPQGDPDEGVVRETLLAYAGNTLHKSDENIICYSDDKKDMKLFFREGYMKFIDAGRRGVADILLIRSFKDLYLSNQQLNDLLFWILPKLPCRLIAVEDEFDSDEATEAEYKAMFEEYKGVRTGDFTRYRAVEREKGLREPKQVIHCNLLYGYIRKDDGCYAEPVTLDVVRKIFQLSKEHHNLKQAVTWLNENGIPTSKAFYLEQGCNMPPEKNPLWTKEKVWGVIKQEGYVQQCRHYEKCMEMGRHCEKMPIVDQETFDEVNEYCRYRKR